MSHIKKPETNFEILSLDGQKLERRKYAKNHKRRNQVEGTNIKQQGREEAMIFKTSELCFETFGGTKHLTHASC